MYVAVRVRNIGLILKLSILIYNTHIDTYSIQYSIIIMYSTHVYHVLMYSTIHYTVLYYIVLYSTINVLLSIQYTFTHIIIRCVVNLKGILPSSDPVQLTPNGYYNNITIDTVRPHPLIIQNPILFIPL